MEKAKQVRWSCAIIWVSIVLLTLPLFAETQSSTRTISATWTDNPPIIDGELTDSDWQRAQIATNFFRAKEGSIHPAQLNTEVRMLYDEHMLYVWRFDRIEFRKDQNRAEDRYSPLRGPIGAIENRSNDHDGGLDLILPISTHLTSNVTFNPDFSQLESDPTQINISSDRELSLPERRPFFREGAELFRLPLNLFYTRRVQEIDFGVKTAGKIGGSNFAVINTYGKMIDRYDADKKKQANLLAGRVNYDIGERTVIGANGNP